MRASLALFALAGLAACGSPQSSDSHVLWFAPGQAEQNYILGVTKPTPY